MEGILNFALVIVVVFGILQIILFFKIWEMTNNVKEIVQKMRFPYNKEESSLSEYWSIFLFLLYNKNKDEAKDYLLKVMWNDVYMSAMVNSRTVESFEEYRNKLQEEYQKWFDKLGEKFPTFENIKAEKQP
mgnify:FL=1